MTAADAVIRHLGPSMSNSRAWNIDAPPQQNANNSQECQTLPGVSLIYVWSYVGVSLLCDPWVWSLHYYVYSMCDVRVGRKTRYTSQLIHMFLEQTIRFTRRFEGTGHQIPFFTRCGDYRRRGNSTFGTFYVELSGLKYRCTSAAECKYSTRMSNFTRRFESTSHHVSFFTRCRPPPGRR